MKLKSMIVRLTIVLAVIFSIFSGPQDALSQTPDTHVFVDPDLSTATTCGTHTIAIGVEEVVDLTAFELLIDFDPAIVEITAVENGGFLVEPGEDAFYSPDNNDGAWNTDGYIIFGMAQQGDGTGDPTPKTGSGDLIQITMNVLVPNATVDFEINPAASMLVDWPDAFEIPFIITNGVVNTASCAPTDITLSNDTVLEKQPIGTEVGVFTATDPDPGDTSFTYSLVDGLSYPDNAAFSIVGDKLLTSEILDYDTKNSYTIKVQSTDPWGEYYEKVFTINVTWVPIATADQYAIKENGSLVLDPPGVLSNDYAPSGNSLTAELVEGLSPGEGTLVFNSDGSLVYVPPEDWTGTVSFSYRACVSELCSEPVTVTLEVRMVPEAVDDSYATYVNETLEVEAPGILENDVLGEDLILTAELLSDIPSGEGSLVLLPDGSFDYSPPVGWTGTTSFTYRACDTVFCSDSATVTINVFDVPIAVDDSYTTLRDEILSVAMPGVLGNDVAPGGVTLTAEIVTDIPIGEGNLVLGSNGSLLYVPPTGWTGSTSFTYKACYDSICSAPATVTIEVFEPECLVVDPAILELTLPPDSSGPLSLSLTNTCSYDVDFNLVERSSSIHEGFEEGDMPPSGGWQTEHLGDTPFEWSIKDAQTNPDHVDEGRFAAWLTYDEFNPSNEWLRSPILDPSTLTDLSLSFRAYSSTDYPDATMKLWVTNAAGVKITTFSTEPLWDMVRDESWDDAEYRSVFVDLSDFAGYSEPIRITWQYEGIDGQSFGLDMIDIGIFSDVPWLTMSPTAGTVPAGETQEVTVNFDSTGLETGDYFAVIDVENTPHPMIPVPVIFHVGYDYYLPIITH